MMVLAGEDRKKKKSCMFRKMINGYELSKLDVQKVGFLQDVLKNHLSWPYLYVKINIYVEERRKVLFGYSILIVLNIA